MSVITTIKSPRGALHFLFFALCCNAAAKYTDASKGTPKLSGVFLSLYSQDGEYAEQQWDNEFAAMAALGIEFVAIRAALQGTSNDTSGGCVLGRYIAYYPTSLTPKSCYQVSSRKNDLMNILKAGQRHNIKVHLTPAMPHTPFAWPHVPYDQYYNSLTQLQLAAFLDVWRTYPEYQSVIGGVYTGLEVWNTYSWMKENNSLPLATHYYEPLAQQIRNATGDVTLKVWASPYYVGNTTLHPAATSADSYAHFWLQMWMRAPSFDFIALQDSMGWQGNSFNEVKEVLEKLKAAAQNTSKIIMSNVELFEGWPAPCTFPKTCGRHPAPISRIVEQLSNEHPYVDAHIAWEWISCLSPYTSNATLKLYNDYSAYISQDLYS